jgi:hypothetical protein
MTALCFMFVIPGFRGVVGSRTLEQSCIVPDLAKSLARRHPLMLDGTVRVEDSRARFFSVIVGGSSRSLEVLHNSTLFCARDV